MQCSQKVGQKKWSHNSSQKTSRTSTPTPPLQQGLLIWLKFGHWWNGPMGGSLRIENGQKTLFLSAKTLRKRVKCRHIKNARNWFLQPAPQSPIYAVATTASVWRSHRTTGRSHCTSPHRKTFWTGAASLHISIDNGKSNTAILFREVIWASGN